MLPTFQVVHSDSSLPRTYPRESLSLECSHSVVQRDRLEQQNLEFVPCSKIKAVYEMVLE